MGSQYCVKRPSALSYLSIYLSVRPSVRMEQLAPSVRIFMELDIWRFSENILRKLKCYWNLTRIKGALHVNLRKFMIVPRCIILRIRSVSGKYCTEIRALVLSNFVPKTVPFVRWCGKNGRAGEDTDENKAYALCMLDDSGCRHTLRICNTYCFSTATVVKRTHSNFTYNVNCLSCSILWLSLVSALHMSIVDT
jgi:hypothetical protein